MAKPRNDTWLLVGVIAAGLLGHFFLPDIAPTTLLTVGGFFVVWILGQAVDRVGDDVREIKVQLASIERLVETIRLER